MNSLHSKRWEDSRWECLNAIIIYVMTLHTVWDLSFFVLQEFHFFFLPWHYTDKWGHGQRGCTNTDKLIVYIFYQIGQKMNGRIGSWNHVQAPVSLPFEIKCFSSHPIRCPLSFKTLIQEFIVRKCDDVEKRIAVRLGNW